MQATTDWRLPNIRELHSIVDYGRFAPAMDPVFASSQAARSGFYWSSTSGAALPYDAWIVGFYEGGVDLGVKGIFSAYVQAVRSGP